jgi:predicted HTH transcriptional regulator
MEGMRISWDELACIGYKVTNQAINKLCQDIVRYRKLAELPKREVNVSQLINWKLLNNSEGGLSASNAFALLTSDFFPFSKTQCAVFKGTTRSVFLDKREYTGPLYEQIDEAIQFVLRNIRLGAEIKGILRKESYELPLVAIREMIINAHCHRNMTDESCVQVALYDDRLEVTSPGGLYNGLTFADMLQGHSKLRNRAIANIFSQMGLVESWGTGIRKIIDAAHEYGLSEPEFIEMPETFRVNLYRKSVLVETSEKHRRNIGEASEKHRRSIGEASENIGGEITEVQYKILQCLKEKTTLSARGLSEIIGITSRNIEENIKKLKANGKLRRHGSPKNGHWEVVGE